DQELGGGSSTRGFDRGAMLTGGTAERDDSIRRLAHNLRCYLDRANCETKRICAPAARLAHSRGLLPLFLQGGRDEGASAAMCGAFGAFGALFELFAIAPCFTCDIGETARIG